MLIPISILKKYESKERNTIGLHLALEIKLNNKWVKVDSTWDPLLEKGGFPLTKKWNGKTDTKFAVKPLSISVFDNPPGKTTVSENREFFKALNRYLEKIRKTKN